MHDGIHMALLHLSILLPLASLLQRDLFFVLLRLHHGCVQELVLVILAPPLLLPQKLRG